METGRFLCTRRSDGESHVGVRREKLLAEELLDTRPSPETWAGILAGLKSGDKEDLNKKGKCDTLSSNPMKGEMPTRLTGWSFVDGLERLRKLQKVHAE